MKAMDCIARVSRQMQFEIAKVFWLQRNRRPMKTEINELQRENVDQSGCRSYNGQLAEVFTTNSTGNRVNVEATGKVPAARPTSITSARCSGSSIASAPTRPTCVYQLRERDTQFDNTRVDDSLLQNRDMYTSNNYREFTAPMSEYSSRNYCGQHGIPSVRMARTKMTARKDRDDRRRDDERRDDNRRSEDRRGRETAKPPARRRRRGTPLPEKYICIFCQKENRQRINHERHLVMQHGCRMDGTPATAADIAQARTWSSKAPTDKSQYKSKEFVESTASEDDDDETPESSSPTRRKSPSPPRRKQAKRERSMSPRRSTLSPPRASTSVPSSMVKVRKVRFDDKKGRQVSTSRPKTKSTETVTTATASLKTAPATQRSRTAAASAQLEGRDKTAKRKETQQKGFEEPSTGEKRSWLCRRRN